MADGLYYVVLNALAKMPCHQRKLPCCLLLAKMYNVAKCLPPGFLQWPMSLGLIN